MRLDRVWREVHPRLRRRRRLAMPANAHSGTCRMTTLYLGHLVRRGGVAPRNGRAAESGTGAVNPPLLLGTSSRLEFPTIFGTRHNLLGCPPGMMP